ncbi:MAG: N-acetyltransferase family protein [Terrimesophilobacter sp.]
MLEEEYEKRRVLPRQLRKPEVGEAPFSFTVRDAARADLPHILEIYNHYVANSTVTFDEDRKSLRSLRAQFDHLSKLGLPYRVAMSPGGRVLGYAYAAPWRQKAAYRHTAESTIYLGPAATGKGLGRALLLDLIERSQAVGIRELIAVIADQGAEGSIALHEALGYVEIGRLGRVGFKFDRWLGTILFQKSLR